MAAIIRWSEPKDSGWTHSRVYRASSKTGTYSLLQQIAIGTYSYTDSSGSSSFWYKVSYWDGVNESSLSEAVQGDTTANYCSLSDFRLISNFSKDKISDAVVITLMPIVSKKILSRISTLHKLERDLVGPIDGSNVIFYVKKKPIADFDMDSDVDISDVLVYYATWDTNNKIVYGSAQTVSSIDARSGSFIVATAPTTTTAEAGLYVTYRSTVENLDYADVRMAANYLLAHAASLKIRGETPEYTGIDAPFIRPFVVGGFRDDPWKMHWLKESWNILREIMGKGKDGIGFGRVDAERNC